ncbi:MAG: tetratricopeptide repeat protein, partial [Nitrospinota bacterium]
MKRSSSSLYQHQQIASTCKVVFLLNGEGYKILNYVSKSNIREGADMNWPRTAIAITIALFIAFGPMPSFGANEKPESNTGKTSSTTADELKELREKANAGDSKSQTDLGQKYQYGWGTKQDYTEAVRWYRKAAEQGDADAQFFLGLMYDIGEGVKQNYAEAV